MPLSQWLLLILLSVLWGLAFFFNGVALREFPPATLVLGRLALAALILIGMVRLLRLPFPTGLAAWAPYAVMSMFNNVIPFMLIARGQQEITSGLASVLNATTPMFSVVLAHIFTPGEKATPLRVLGVLFGFAGVAILFGPDLTSGRTTTAFGMALVLGAAASYGCAGVWGSRFRTTSPIVSSCCQLVCSSIIMLVLAAALDRPWTLPMPGLATLVSIAGLATLSTALAYVVFYRILAVSGGTNSMLVTLLMPVVSILLGVLVLGETFEPRFAVGALVIAAALLTIDGRLPRAIIDRTRG
jgi:drug/metabolite transporter (DMT)-like permease